MKSRSSEVINRYLQTIFSLLENKKQVKAVDLTKLLKTTPSTVHATLARMQRDDLVYLDQKKRICLTDRGSELAIGLVRQRRLAEMLLCEKLDIPLDEAQEHVIPLIQGLTPLIEEKLTEFLGNPRTCPHGRPIPYHTSRQDR